MSKSLVITKKSVHSVLNEKALLSQLKHPYILSWCNNFVRLLVNMHIAFQDRENLFLVLDYMPGGDLRYHIGRMKKFTE